MRVVLIVIGFLFIFSGSMALAQDEPQKKEGDKEKEMFVVPASEQQAPAVQQEIDQVLNPFGLQFTQGGVRPILEGEQVYPDFGTILFLSLEQIQELKKREVEKEIQN